jgi:ribosomal-protein-serine acetyltransferase
MMASVFTLAVDDGTALELLQEEHAEEIFAVVDRNRERLRERLPWLDQNRSVEGTRAFARLTLERFARRQGVTCVIRHRGALVGVIDLHELDLINRGTRIGYWIDGAHEGRGVVTRATAALIAHAFRDLRLHRVEIRCDPENLRSAAIPERLGFRKDGVLRDAAWQYEHFVDHAVYALLEGEWTGGPAPRP